MANLIYDKSDDGTFKISKDFIPDIEFNRIGEDYVLLVEGIEISKLTKFEDVVEGDNSMRYLVIQWRISKDDGKCKWSKWIDLDRDFKMFPENLISTKYKYNLEFKWTRVGSDLNGNILLKSVNIEGEYDRFILPEPRANLTYENFRDPVYIRPEDTFKVFRIDDVEVITSQNDSQKSIYIEYRVSQDNWRTSTRWEPLNKENISTLIDKYDVSPIRFFWIEYKLTRRGSDSSGVVKIHDINLVGDIQNVSEDYTKTNLLGIRACCSCLNSSYLPIGNNEGNGIPGFNNKPMPMPIPDLGGDASTMPSFPGLGGGDGCSLPNNLADPIGSGAICDNAWNPYDISKAALLYASLSESTTQMFGWEVVYFLTDPDSLGTDKTFHEHQLYNVVDENQIKVMVDQNQFPDNQIVFNQFDLTLFETFEIHITKKEFKKMFGVDQRPSKEDFLWFCELNRIYQVEHAQPYRDFLNAAVYYKVILKKYNQKSSVKAATPSIEAKIQNLTSNTTLDELFGIDMERDKEEVANPKDLSTLTKDEYRYEFFAEVVRELILNSTLVINKYHYNLGSVASGSSAIIYSIKDNLLRKGDNRSYSCWFRVSDYVVNEKHNFFSNYDEVNKKGIKIDMFESKIEVQINNTVSSMEIDDLMDDTWYIYTVNIDQRLGTITQYLYKRNADDEAMVKRLPTSELKLIKKNYSEVLPQEYEMEKGNEITIKGSPMNITNIRFYNDIINEKDHTKVLNQYVIRDTDYLIIGDNSNKKVTLENFPYN